MLFPLGEPSNKKFAHSPSDLSHLLFFFSRAFFPSQSLPALPSPSEGGG
jgi:hypothetical protein